MRPLRIVVLGNGPFIIPTLHTLAQSTHQILLVVCRPDRPVGKKGLIEDGPAKKAALELGLPVEQPESVNTAEYQTRLRQLAPDLLVVADFGQLLKPAVLALAPMGGINLHGSLLPKYRGAAPIVWAIYDGAATTGVTVIHMTAKMDAGGVLLQGEVPIGPDQTAAELERELAGLAAELILPTIAGMQAGTLTPMPQNPDLVTQAPKLTKEHGLILWQRTAQAVHNQVRAMLPWPIAYTHWQRPAGEPMRLQVLRTQPLPQGEFPALQPGQVVAVSRKQLVIQAGQDVVELLQVQRAGKTPTQIADFLNGHRVQVGEHFR